MGIRSLAPLHPSHFGSGYCHSPKSPSANSGSNGVKILFMNTFSTVHGGAERLLFDTSTELIARGHEVSMVIAHDDRRSKNPEFWPSRINRYYIPELVLPFTDRYSYNGMRRAEQYVDAKRYLQDILNIEEPDLIHVHNFPCLEV